MALFHLQRDIQDINRLRQIVQVFFQEGLGHYVLKVKLGKHLPFRKRLMAPPPLSSAAEAGIHIRHAFERLGPSFVKLGQLLSLRVDIVPLAMAKELEKLQDQVPPFSFADVKKILEQEWGKPVEKVLQIEEKPLACASVSQVHLARLGGKKVIVKVQRPHIQELLAVDLDILFHLAYLLENHIPALRQHHPLDVVKEFAFWSRRELDFSQEARSALRLKEEMRGNKKVYIPFTYLELCTPRVLVQEFVQGTKLSKISPQKKQRRKLAMTYFNALLEQSLLHGFFHADPHPANILLDKRGRLVFLDFGIMGYLTQSDRLKVIRFIRSLKDKNAEKSMQIILSLARDLSQANIEGWKREALPLLEEVYHHSIKERSLGKAIYELLSFGAKYRVIFDPNHVLMAKTIYQAEGLGLQLYSGFQVREGFERFSGNAHISTRKLVKKTLNALWEKTEELPEQLEEWLTLKSQSQGRGWEDFEQELERGNRQRNLALLSGIFFLGGLLLLSWEGITQILGISLQLVVFSLAGIFLLLLIKTHRGEYDGEIR